MIVDILTYLGALALITGAGFGLVAAIGIVRLPDLLTRMHAASKAGAVGGGLIFLAVAMTCFDLAIAVRAVVGIVFVLFTTPVAAHLLAKASREVSDSPHKDRSGIELKSQSEP